MVLGRLFEIVYILMERERVTANELATHFEVSIRTIYRDIDTLSASGIPVYMSKGKGGGISLLPNFVFDKSLITEEEKKEVLASLQAIDSVGLEEKTTTALMKLKNVFGMNDSNWIEVDFGFWSDGEKEAEIFKILKTAILEKKEISFQYTGIHNTTTDRIIEPLKLVFKGTSWYLYGYCQLRNDYRFFKLKRIKELKVLNVQFQRIAPERVLSENTYSEKGDLIHVKLQIALEEAFRVYDDFTNYKLLGDGSFLVEETVNDGEWFINLLISYGEHIKILEPLELRERLKEKLKSILKGYEQ